MGEKSEKEVMKWSSPHAGELTAPSKTGSVLLKWKWLPFAPVWLAISRTRKEFWCQTFIPKSHSTNWSILSTWKSASGSEGDDLVLNVLAAEA